MKLALISLTLCCCVYVSVTYQQQQHQFMSRRYPLPYYYNSYYDSPQQLSRNYWMGQQDPSFFGQQNNYIQPQNPSFDSLMSLKELVMEDVKDDYGPTDDLILDQDIQGRSRFNGLFKGASLNNYAAVENNNKESRLFFFNNILFGKGRVVTIVTSTLTTLTVQSCVAASQFIATTACRRRRRDAHMIGAELQEDDAAGRRMLVDVFPAQVQPMETSAPPPDQIHDYDSNNGLWSQNEIESSSFQPMKGDDDTNARKKRSFFYTSTFTSYVLSGTTSTKSISLGIAGCISCLSCLPSGISIC